MMRKVSIAATVIIALGLAGFLTFAPAIADDRFNPVTSHAPFDISDAARALHDSLIVGDLHADSLLWNRDLTVRNDHGHVDFPRLVDGNVAFQVFTAVTKSPSGLNYGENATDAPDDITRLAVAQLWPVRTWSSLLERALYQADKLHGFAREAADFRPYSIIVIREASDIALVLDRRARGLAVIGAILGIEGAHPLEGDIANLDRLEDAGYRVIALQHFFDNDLGGSLHGVTGAGLTDFGHLVVAQVQARGMILDVAHSSEQVVRDVLDATDMPIIISHTGIDSHCPSPRNIPDDLMERIAATGGLIGIGFWADVTCDDTPTGVARAIIAAVALVGVDHVALGSDYDGTVRMAFDASELAAVTQALIAEGLADADIAAVMGGNMVRVFSERLAARP